MQQQPPPPALPDELLEALSRAPPDPPPRASLSLDRLDPHTAPPTLPDVHPHSPFGLAYPYTSSSNSPTNPRAPQPDPSASSTPLVGFSMNRTDVAAPEIPPSTSSSRFPRTGSTSPNAPRTVPPSPGNKRSMFRTFTSFGRASRPPASSPALAELLPPSIDPSLAADPSSSSSSSAAGPSSPWSRAASPSASAPLSTRPTPPISRTAPPSSASAPPHSPSRFPPRMQPPPPPFASHALPPTPPPLAARMSRGPSAASLAGAGGPLPVPDDWSESVQDAPSDAEDASADGEQYTAWSVRGGQVEQYTRDLTRVRRSASVAKPGQARVSGREEEEEDEEELPYAQVEDEDEDERGYDSERDAEGMDSERDSAAAAALRRPSVMSLRHQLATIVSSDAPLPLPVHIAELSEHEQPQQNGEEVEQGRRVAQLDLRELSLREKEDDNAQPRQDVSPVSSADFIVAVVGPRNVGKSTVIRRGLKRPPEEPIVLHEDADGNRVTTSTTSFTISGQRRTIEVLEIDMHMLKYNEEGVVWPDGLPQCEAAMLCYDSTDPHALSSLSILLKAFWTRGSDVPLIVLACKSAPAGSSANATDPKDAASVCNVYGAGIVTLDGGVEDPQRKAKECFNWLIRQIMNNRGEVRRPSTSMSTSSDSRRGSLPDSRRGSLRKGSFATISSSPITAHPPEASFPANLADPSPSQPLRSSRLVRTDSLALALSVVEEAPFGSDAFAASAPPTSVPRQGTDFEAEAEAAVAAMLASVAAEEGDQTEEHVSVPGPQLAASENADAPLPAYEAQEPPLDQQQQHEQQQQQQQQQQQSVAEETVMAGVLSAPSSKDRRASKNGSLELFFRREDLLDKFLFAAVAGNDEQFVTLFLITFRRFARPYDVLEKLIERFDFVASKHASDPLLSRFGQMKLCGVLSTWMQNYPGDFTAATTFGLLEPFLEGLIPRGATWVAHYAFELVPLLPSIASMADPETGWALPDKPLDEPTIAPPAENAAAWGSVALERQPFLAPSFDSSSSLALSRPPESVDPASVSRLSVPGSLETGETSPSLPYSSPRPASENGTLDSAGADSSSSPSMTRRMPASAVLVDMSNALVEMREQDIATQITRLAWEIFAGMSPRDLVRHVLAARDPSNPRLALRDAESPVVRSINFVNYLAAWTATMILVQSKVKARARVAEKFLLVAAALREQENFDSLMGVLAGLNSQPVFRLTETMEIVTDKLDGDPRMHPQRTAQPDGDKHRLPKKLRSLNRLMAANKSFAAYRLALANSGINMIPYLGVHLQDLTVLNEVKSDMRGGLVNWTKFSQMGKSAAIVLDCARVAPKLPVDRTIERCIFNVPVLDEDRQYTLSYAHQPRQTDRTGTRARLRELAKSTFASSL
ncbi:uncharacterized protein JCM10292_004489 [Rhodotorula paludigena]|uniref:uncharacterized protein n=1 Tax=Rhodotorula paludigena TaxID=86838 RepID=UPI003175F5B8